MKTLIQHVQLVTMNATRDVFPDGYLIIQDTRIVALGAMENLTEELSHFDKVIDGEQGILMPGMINTHTHIGMVPFRSLGDDVPDRLRRFLFPLEQHMTKELAYHSGKYAIAEMQLAGVTSFMDMYYFEDELAKATAEMGSRGILGETVIDFPTCDAQEPHGGLAYAENYIPKWLGNPLITPAIAPHAPNTNSQEALEKTTMLAEKYDVPVSLHVAEMDYEVQYFMDKYGLTPVGYLHKIGFLSPRVIAAHCIFLTDDDIELLKITGTKVAHCIGANTKSAKGVARIQDLLAAGVPVGLGTDGPSSGNTLDLFTQMKLFANFHKTTLKDRGAFPAVEIVALATNGGAEVLGLSKEVGSLEVGKQADVVLVETKSVNMFPNFDPYAVLVYSGNASNVEMVYINGRCVVEKKQLVQQSLSSLQQNLQAEMSEFKKRTMELAD